jgi:hypothetical protein
METKEFNKVSSEHSGVRSGTKFITTKFHHEVQGDVEEGTELVLEKIAHYPTRYLLKDENGKIWTLPIHSVKEAIEEDTKEKESAKEAQEELAPEEVENQDTDDQSIEGDRKEEESTEEVQEESASEDVGENDSEGIPIDEKK